MHGKYHGVILEGYVKIYFDTMPYGNNVNAIKVLHENDKILDVYNFNDKVENK